MRAGGGVWSQVRSVTFTLGGGFVILESRFGHPAPEATALK